METKKFENEIKKLKKLVIENESAIEEKLRIREHWLSGKNIKVDGVEVRKLKHGKTRMKAQRFLITYL